MMSQIKIYVFIFVSEEIDWNVEGTESEPHSDNCAARLGIWWSWGKTLQVWGYDDLGVRHCKSGGGVVWGWDTVQDWEYGGLGVRHYKSEGLLIFGWDTAKLGVWWSWGETLCKTGIMVILGWDTAGLGVWWSWGEALQDWEYGDLGARILIQSVLSLILLCPYFCVW